MRGEVGDDREERVSKSSYTYTSVQICQAPGFRGALKKRTAWIFRNAKWSVQLLVVTARAEARKSGVWTTLNLSLSVRVNPP